MEESQDAHPFGQGDGGARADSLSPERVAWDRLYA